MDFGDVVRRAATHLSSARFNNIPPQRLFDSTEFVADMFQLNFKRRGPNN
jgi:hypothetical protein